MEHEPGDTETVVVGVLGPTAILGDDGGTIDRSPRLAALLAWCVLLAREQPADPAVARRDLFGHLAPDAARRELARQAERLGRLLPAPASLTSGPDRLVLHLPDGSADVDRFEVSAAQARRSHDRPERVLQRCRAALGWWRGPRAYADLEGLPPAVSEADRLAEEREDLLDRRDGLRLLVGADVALVLDLRARWRQAGAEAGAEAGAAGSAGAGSPARPLLARQLAVALAGAGRPADGIRVFDEARRRWGSGGLDEASAAVEAALLAGRAPAPLESRVLPDA